MVLFMAYSATVETYEYQGVVWKYINCDTGCVPVPQRWPEGR